MGGLLLCAGDVVATPLQLPLDWGRRSAPVDTRRCSRTKHLSQRDCHASSIHASSVRAELSRDERLGGISCVHLWLPPRHCSLHARNTHADGACACLVSATCSIERHHEMGGHTKPFDRAKALRTTSAHSPGCFDRPIPNRARTGIGPPQGHLHGASWHAQRQRERLGHGGCTREPRGSRCRRRGAVLLFDAALFHCCRCFDAEHAVC